MIIPFELLNKFKALYEEKGFLYIDVPYVVDYDVDNFTRPGYNESIIHEVGKTNYAGSGEQGFLQLIKNGSFLRGNLQTITVCNRGDYPDDIHFKTFVKLELFSTEMGYEEMANMVLSLYPEGCYMIKYSDSIDIESYDNVELGSYGERTFMGVKYTYGTGLALPRFSNEYAN